MGNFLKALLYQIGLLSEETVLCNETTRNNSNIPTMFLEGLYCLLQDVINN